MSQSLSRLRSQAISIAARSSYGLPSSHGSDGSAFEAIIACLACSACAFHLVSAKFGASPIARLHAK